MDEKEKANTNENKEMLKKSATMAGRAYAGKFGEMGAKIILNTKVGDKLLEDSSKIVSNINRNPFSFQMNGIQVNNNSQFLKNEIENQSEANSVSEEIFNSNSNEDNKQSDSIFKDLSLSSMLFGNKNDKYRKIKLYLMIGSASLVVFLFVFIIIFLDSTMSKQLKVLDFFSNISNKIENVISNSNFSSDGVESMSTNIEELFGNDGIKLLEEKINSGVSDDKSLSVATVITTLIDALNEKNVKLSYQSDGRPKDGIIIDSNWGVSKDNNSSIINGLDNMGLFIWALNVCNIKYIDNFSFENMNIYETPNYVNYGDILYSNNDIKIVLQNTGSTLIVADYLEDGLVYREYKYSNITGYKYLNMSDYYNSNTR